MTADAIAGLSQRIAAHALASPLGVAVSGGSDSTALLLAAHATGQPVHGFTIDHGLRPDAATEARHVADLCAGLGCPHDIVTLGLDPGPNLQARAREARYGALAAAARDAGVGTVLLGHTADDVAETLVMRLSRGAGIDGLARMAETRRDRGVDWVRPALGLTRADLRAALTARGVGWVDDPSNDDPDFTRVAARQAIATLRLDVRALAASAEALSDARDSLAVHAQGLAKAHIREDRGDLLLDQPALAQRLKTDPDPVPRLLLAALKWIGGRPYGPRREERARLLANVLSGQPCTLAGCHLSRDGETLRITREAAACAPPGATDTLWDGRWVAIGPHAPNLTLGPLGDDITQAPWRETGLPRVSLLASPAIRDGTRLIAAPLAGLCNGWQVQTRIAFIETIIHR